MCEGCGRKGCSHLLPCENCDRKYCPECHRDLTWVDRGDFEEYCQKCRD